MLSIFFIIIYLKSDRFLHESKQDNLYIGRMLKILEHSSNMITVGFLTVSLAAAALAGCSYKITNLQIDTCDGKPIKEWTVTGASAEFTDDCSILFKGCTKWNVEMTELELEYKGSKNKMELGRGKKQVCGLSLFDTKFECPMAKGMEKCANEKWVQKIPNSALSLAIGHIDGEAKFKTNVGEFCYKFSTDIKLK